MEAEIETALLKICKQEDIIDAFIENSITPGQGQGYLSDMSIINVIGKTKTGEKCKKSFVIKIAATNPSLREVSAVPELFTREIYMYEHVFPAFHNFEKERGIRNPFSCVPKFYQAFKNTIPEILILENLKEDGYQIWNGKIKMEHDHVEDILKEYGRFHAVSFVIRDQDPKLFQVLTKNFDNTLVTFLKKSGFYNTFIYKAKQVLTLLDPEEDIGIFKKYETFLKGIDEKFDYLITVEDDFCAILHGDCWSNNMLFKYKDSNREKPSEIRLIDFQIAKLGSPVLDLVYFFYVSTSQEVFKNLNNYQRIYYNSFLEHTKSLGSDGNVLYPFSVFNEHWRKYAIFGLILSSLVNSTFLREEHELINLTEVIESGGSISKAFEGDISNTEEYKKRMKFAIEHFVENDFI